MRIGIARYMARHKLGEASHVVAEPVHKPRHGLLEIAALHDRARKEEAGCSFVLPRGTHRRELAHMAHLGAEVGREDRRIEQEARAGDHMVIIKHHGMAFDRRHRHMHAEARAVLLDLRHLPVNYRVLRFQLIGIEEIVIHGP